MENQLISLAAELGRALKAKNWRITCAESCTGGAVATAITEVAGSSQWFEGGFVTYSNRMKEQMLALPAELLASCGAVSEEVVIAMAQGALASTGAQLAVATSGIAGPDGGTVEKPVGTVWMAWVNADGQQASSCIHFDGSRHSIRQQAAAEALRGSIRLSK